jgi:predicted TIM-barrel fold metal-dependent hydrolase
VVKSGVAGADIVRRMVDIFGPDRLVGGSDVGQSLLWCDSEKVSMARDATQLLTADERANFLHRNAARIYRIPAAAPATEASRLRSANRPS